MPYRIAFTALFAVVLGAASPASAQRCLEGMFDHFQVPGARIAVKETCGCFEFPSHTQYVKCAGAVVEARIASNQLRKECFRLARAEAIVSVCGKPVNRYGPAVPCVDLDARGRAVCRIKPAGRCATPCPGSISCVAAADDDGDLVVGFGDTGTCRPPPPLVDPGDGTIVDVDKGLMWERLDDAGGLHDKDAPYVWADAVGDKIAQLNAQTFAGHADWRLPTIMELHSLVRPGSSPAVAAEMDAGCLPGCSACSCTRPDFHWSSTVVPLDPVLAWSLFFGAGTSSTLDRDDFELSVRAVRSLP